MAEQVKVPCQAVAVRFVADTRTDEFLNIGVVLFCPDRRYAGAKFLTSWARISQAFPAADLVHLRRLKRLFESACETWTASAQEPALFREIGNLRDLLASMLALDDATITFSNAISGVTANPEATLAELFRLYGGETDDEEALVGRDDETVWNVLVRLAQPELVHALTRHTIRSSHYEQIFERSWRNGAWNAAQPLSFDMQDPQRIRDKALLWSSRIRELRPAENDTTVHFLVGLPEEHRPKEVRKAARDAFDILNDTIEKDDARIVPEAKAAELVKKIEEDLAHAAE
jgi:hypothetical protein